jgi:hypothetical protein
MKTNVKRGTETTIFFDGKFIVKSSVQSFFILESHFGSGCHEISVNVELTTGGIYTEIVASRESEKEYFESSSLIARYSESNDKEKWFKLYEITKTDFEKLKARNSLLRKKIVAKADKRLKEVIADYEK